jgi:hypothetical protein
MAQQVATKRVSFNNTQYFHLIPTNHENYENEKLFHIMNAPKKKRLSIHCDLSGVMQRLTFDEFEHDDITNAPMKKRIRFDYDLSDVKTRLDFGDL